MNRQFVASSLTTAVGLALAQVPTLLAQGALELSSAPQEGAHNCARELTRTRGTMSFGLLPGGDCAEIQGRKPTLA